MIPKCNLHAHTTFCDGKNTAEEMVQGAIRQGCEVLGFSGHSPLPFDASWCMTEEKNELYRAEILRLREKYRGKIDILCGIEYDSFSVCSRQGYDYIIGSVHHVEREGIYIPVDGDRRLIEAEVARLFGGDYLAYAREYYEQMYTLKEKTDCDIVGHFDLLTKYNEDGSMFDEASASYRDAALSALEAVLKQDLLIEINTGAISRGYRKTPYPAPFILKYIAEKKGRVILNSDSHAADTVLYFYSEAVEYAKSCGIKELYVYQNGAFVPFAI